MKKSKRYPGLSSQTANHVQHKLACMQWEEITQACRNACKDCPGAALDECQFCPLNALALNALHIAVLSRSERNKEMIEREINARYRKPLPNSEEQPYPGDTSKADSSAQPIGGESK